MCFQQVLGCFACLCFGLLLLLLWLLVVVVGCWLLVVGCWLLVVGCWLLVVGCWLLVVGCWLLVVGCWLLVVGCCCGGGGGEGAGDFCGCCLCHGGCGGRQVIFVVVALLVFVCGVGLWARFVGAHVTGTCNNIYCTHRPRTQMSKCGKVCLRILV